MLPQTLESVFNQTYQPIEILVMDDGSTDNTSEMIRAYNGRLRYYQQENQGVAIARMNASRLAKGEYIAFQDDDDLMPVDRINHLYKALNTYPAAILAVGDWIAIDQNGMPTGNRWLPEGRLSKGPPILIDDGYEAILWPSVPATPHTTLFRKDDGERVGWFDRRFLYAAEDKDFFARLAKLGPIVYIPEIVSYYRRGHDSLTKNTILKETQKIMFFKKHLNSLPKNQNKIVKRLRFRILMSLLRIERAKYAGIEQADYSFEKYRKEGIALLGLKEKLLYYWKARVKLPILNMLQ